MHLLTAVMSSDLTLILLSDCQNRLHSPDLTVKFLLLELLSTEEMVPLKTVYRAVLLLNFLNVIFQFCEHKQNSFHRQVLLWQLKS